MKIETDAECLLAMQELRAEARRRGDSESLWVARLMDEQIAKHVVGTVMERASKAASEEATGSEAHGVCRTDDDVVEDANLNECERFHEASGDGTVGRTGLSDA
jgi:hypothetical protein